MKVYLKYNRIDAFSDVCLLSWLNLFINDEVVIITDLYNVKTENPPEKIKRLIFNKKINILNSDRSLTEKYCPLLSKKGRRHAASANLTCFEESMKLNEHFWLIDADDTMFLHNDYQYVRNKLKIAEDIFIKNNLDGLSIDFYKEFNGMWSFGVCLLKSTLDLSLIKKHIDSNQDIRSDHLDSYFHLMNEKKIYNLKSFVLNGIGFQHLINNFDGLQLGIYYWDNNKLWDRPLLSDVISI